MAKDRRQPRGPRWCNAHAIADEHAREVLDIFATAESIMLRLAHMRMIMTRRLAA